MSGAYRSRNRPLPPGGISHRRAADGLMRGGGTRRAWRISGGERLGDGRLGLGLRGAGVVQQLADAAQGLDHLRRALVVLLPQGVELSRRPARPFATDQAAELAVETLLDGLHVTRAAAHV